MTCFGGPTGTLGSVRESLLLGDRLPQRCPAGKQPARAHPQLWGFCVCVLGCLRSAGCPAALPSESLSP